MSGFHRAPAGRPFISAQNWLGTDELGRDLLARLMQGVLVSITVALLVQAMAQVIIDNVPGLSINGVKGEGFRVTLDSHRAIADLLH